MILLTASDYPFLARDAYGTSVSKFFLSMTHTRLPMDAPSADSHKELPEFPENNSTDRIFAEMISRSVICATNVEKYSTCEG